MDSMIERVARAMCVADGDDPDLVLAINSAPPGQPSCDKAIPLWHGYVAQARAAIAAMREPTEAMIAAGVEARCEHGESQCGAAYSWQEMIDSALKEGE